MSAPATCEQPQVFVFGGLALILYFYFYITIMTNLLLLLLLLLLLCIVIIMVLLLLLRGLAMLAGAVLESPTCLEGVPKLRKQVECCETASG